MRGPLVRPTQSSSQPSLLVCGDFQLLAVPVAPRAPGLLRREWLAGAGGQHPQLGSVLLQPRVQPLSSSTNAGRL